MLCRCWSCLSCWVDSTFFLVLAQRIFFKLVCTLLRASAFSLFINFISLPFIFGESLSDLLLFGGLGSVAFVMNGGVLGGEEGGLCVVGGRVRWCGCVVCGGVVLGVGLRSVTRWLGSGGDCEILSRVGFDENGNVEGVGMCIFFRVLFNGENRSWSVLGCLDKGWCLVESLWDLFGFGIQVAYLKGKPQLGLWYPRVSLFDLEAYSDSDYAGANLDRKSTIGGCQFLGRRLISWQCKKQTIVATSTTEAEYVAAANCCGQVLWIQNQMLDYGFNFMNTKIHIDNESTICIVKNPVYHSKTKHITIRHHFIRDAYAKKLIQVLKIHTDDNVADLLTKAFDVSRFQFLVVTITMINT
ncbi:hypothetical protein Tco_0978280 [Tanacetum coccineum]|uniref:Uncharacterized protein n=1 Tax=Tanacetum coccineum TaxID=301880 RepID=A0ABQ5EMG1_9ASTR